MQLDDPTALALLAADALGRAGIEHALYGGLLLAAYGEARETRDADMAVAGASATEAARALATTGIHATVALERARFGGLFVVFKVLSTRDKDLDDAASVLSTLRSEIDREQIEAEVRALQGEMANHPVAERWRRVRDIAAPQAGGKVS